MRLHTVSVPARDQGARLDLAGGEGRRDVIVVEIAGEEVEIALAVFQGTVVGGVSLCV